MIDVSVFEYDEKGVMDIMREEGKEEGIKEGIKEGREEANIEAAKKLLQLGVDIDIIVKSTSLTKERVMELQKEI